MQTSLNDLPNQILMEDLHQFKEDENLATIHANRGKAIEYLTNNFLDQDWLNINIKNIILETHKFLVGENNITGFRTKPVHIAKECLGKMRDIRKKQFSFNGQAAKATSYFIFEAECNFFMFLGSLKGIDVAATTLKAQLKYIIYFDPNRLDPTVMQEKILNIITLFEIDYYKQLAEFKNCNAAYLQQEYFQGSIQNWIVEQAAAIKRDAIFRNKELYEDIASWDRYQSQSHQHILNELTTEELDRLKTIFKLCPSPDQIETMIDEFSKELLHKVNSGSNLIEIAAFVHHTLVSIHPFDDGNGRTARLFMNSLLVKLGQQPILIGFNNDTMVEKYYEAVENTDLDPGKFTEYLKLQLQDKLQRHNQQKNRCILS